MGLSSILERPTAGGGGGGSQTIVWRTFFMDWPADLARTGLVVTTWEEQIPFAGFLTSPTMLLLDRSTPDSVGARKIVLPYENVAAVKLTEVIKQKVFNQAGFEGNLAKK